jgi:hypothetical protein
MGIIVNDKIDLPIGTSKVQCYFNIGNETILIQRHANIPGLYTVSVSFCIYFDQESYLKNGLCMDKQKLTITLRTSELSQNLYQVLYDNLKNTYTSYINI